MTFTTLQQELYLAKEIERVSGILHCVLFKDFLIYFLSFLFSLLPEP